ncbi:NAD(P)H:quinone oxidoreductase-like isoform X3 [Asparagus officinalis]|uniref:NAD(P)H:quinone oxidoreductase-like isoform X3 n=1 Tax=Asparagus officinalis TaxID=4686 RepID=UPI00098E6522|nr:NAD(P)H:quinone oxidoreductase-like isoform X3 [Asparagus officinalis]
MEAKPVIKVAAVCGSLRKASFNRGLILSAIEICNESIRGMEVEFVDISGLPFINPDLENGSEFPEAVEEFRRKILEADCFLFASPEYNYSIPGFWASTRRGGNLCGCARSKYGANLRGGSKAAGAQKFGGCRKGSARNWLAAFFVWLCKRKGRGFFFV